MSKVQKFYSVNSLILQKFVSHLTKSGKKFKAEKILKNVLIKIALKGFAPIKVLIFAINNVKPLVEVRNFRAKNRKSFQVPFPLKFMKQISLSLKIILKSCVLKKNFEDSLVDELVKSSQGQSQSVKITKNIHKLAYQNRIFIRYRWF